MRTLLVLALVSVMACGGSVEHESQAAQGVEVDCSEARCKVDFTHPKRCFVALEGVESLDCSYRLSELCPTPAISNPCR